MPARRITQIYTIFLFLDTIIIRALHACAADYDRTDHNLLSRHGVRGLMPWIVKIWICISNGGSGAVVWALINRRILQRIAQFGRAFSIRFILQISYNSIIWVFWCEITTLGGQSIVRWSFHCCWLMLLIWVFGDSEKVFPNVLLHIHLLHMRHLVISLFIDCSYKFQCLNYIQECFLKFPYMFTCTRNIWSSMLLQI